MTRTMVDLMCGRTGRLPLALAIGLIAAGSMASLKAENVAWKEASDIRGDADLSTAGTPVDGIQCYVGRNVQGSGKPAADIRIGDTVFHAIAGSGAAYGDGTITVTTGAPAAQFENGTVRGEGADDTQFNAFPIGNGVSADYSAVVSNGIFYQGSAIGSIVLNKLVPGHVYQMQVWGMVQYSRPGRVDFYDDLGNTGTLDSNAHLPKKGVLAPGQPYGQSIIGLFQAHRDTASIDWGGGDGCTYPCLSAIALRDVTDVSGMKETAAAVGPPPPAQPLHDPAGFTGADEWPDIVYARVGRHPLKLDVIVPRNAPQPVPIVIYIHGGGWGGLDRTEGFANQLVAQGFAVVPVDYRLSGEAAWPAQMEDCKAAVRWLRAHAAAYGCSGTKIGALGDSAGGHLVSILGLTGGKPDFEGNEGNKDVSSAVQAVADYFGPSDLVLFASTKDSSVIQKLMGGPLSSPEIAEKARLASPLTWVTPQAPPFLIVHGDADQSVPIQQSIDFNAALQKAGVDSQLYVMKGKPHGANEKGAVDLVVALFNKYLR